MKTVTLNAKFKKSNEVLLKEKAFAKKVKMAFILIPSFFLTVYIIANVIIGINY